jgi:NAD-dependent dihydropyrimidine dehydrogenase PreA subunit
LEFVLDLGFVTWNLGSNSGQDSDNDEWMMYPVVDSEKCNGCGNCAEICPSEVYEIQEEKSNPIRPEDCIECGACVNQCQTESIQLSED